MDALKENLKTAIKIELATIPLYLYAMHSLRIDDTDQGKKGAVAKSKIGLVVQQEMLHVALAGNVLTSLDSEAHLGPKLYSEEYLVQYGRDDVLFFEIPLRLEPCNKASLEWFMKLESPYIEPEDDGEPVPGAPLPGDHDPNVPLITVAQEAKSIGEFYAKLKRDVTRTTHWGNRDYQFSPAEFFSTSMVQVTDKESALKTLEFIVEQGEGSSAALLAHYQMFHGLWENVDWNCWPVPSSPTTEDYRDSPFVYQLALAFNAAFCYLLITIQKTWEIRKTSDRQALVRNIHAVMLNISGPLGYFMAKQPFKGGTAGPPFEYYPIPGGQDLERVDQTAKDLHRATEVHLDNAIAVASSAQSTELWPIRMSLDEIKWPL